MKNEEVKPGDEMKPKSELEGWFKCCGEREGLENKETFVEMGKNDQCVKILWG